MKCPKCGSEHIIVSAVNEVKFKRRKGLLYWIFIGWWWELFAWIYLTLFKIIIAIFAPKKNASAKTVTYAVCQDCGNRWQIK